MINKDDIYRYQLRHVGEYRKTISSFNDSFECVQKAMQLVSEMPEAKEAEIFTVEMLTVDGAPDDAPVAYIHVVKSETTSIRAWVYYANICVSECIREIIND